MRTLTALLVTLCLVSAAYADYTTIADFSTYNLGTVHGQGGWEVQANTNAIGDPGYVTVVTDATYGQVLNLQNRDTNGEIDTIYAALDLGISLAGKDTLKVTFRSDGPNDTLMCTNDMEAGFDGDGDGAVDDDGQGCTNYSEQGAMVVLKSADVFRARDGGGYTDVDGIGTSADTWYDLYLLIDSPNDRTIYAMCPAGGTPTIIASSDDAFWGHRNQTWDNDAVENLKFMIGGYPWPAMDTETNVQIAEISYMNGWDANVPEPATMSLLALGGLAVARRRRK